MDWKQLFIGSLDVLRNISKYLSYRDTVRFLESLKIIDLIDLLKVEDKNGCENCGNVINNDFNTGYCLSCIALCESCQYPEEMCFGIKKECINYDSDSEIENLANYINEIYG